MVGTVEIESLLSSSLPIVVIDESYTITAASAAWQERVKNGEGTPVGKTLTEFIPEDERQDIRTRLSAAFDGSADDSLPLPVTNTGGNTYRDRYLLIRGSGTAGQSLCLVGETTTGGQRPTPTEGETQERTELLERQRKQITRLHEVAVDLAKCEHADDVYETMVTAAEEILSLDICLADAVVDDRLVVKATSSEVPSDGYREPAIAHAGMAGTVYERGESLLYNPQEHPEANPHDEEFRQSLAVPIGKFGVFQATAYDPDAFDQTDLELVELLCKHAREALNRIEQERVLRERSQELELLRRIFGRIFRHNVRNELNIILSNAELIESHTVDEPLVDSAETIMDSTNRLLSHTENAKQLDQLMRTGDETIILSLPSLVSRAVERCCEEYPDADITVDVEDIHVTVHPTITTAIETALENSLTHNDEAVSITVSTTVGEQVVSLCIQDTGTGIPKEELQVINREHETSMTHSTGVGLWLMKWAVEKSGGELSLRNTDDGACVKMTLPQATYAP